MKTTKKEFKAFKKAFRRWQKLLNRNDYEAYFEMREMDDAYADLHINHVAKTAMLGLAKKHDRNWRGPEDSAKHEAIHLLVNRLTWLGMKNSGNLEFEEEEHVVVRVLEHVLKGV